MTADCIGCGKPLKRAQIAQKVLGKTQLALCADCKAGFDSIEAATKVCLHCADAGYDMVDHDTGDHRFPDGTTPREVFGERFDNECVCDCPDNQDGHVIAKCPNRKPLIKGSN